MLEISLWDQNLAVLGLSTPSGLRSSTGFQKGTYCTEITFLEPSLTSVQLFVRAVREPKNAEKNKSTKTKKGTENVFRVYVRRPLQPIVMLFSTARDLADLINRAKLGIDRFKGFGLREGQSWGLP